MHPLPINAAPTEAEESAAIMQSTRRYVGGIESGDARHFQPLRPTTVEGSNIGLRLRSLAKYFVTQRAFQCSVLTLAQSKDTANANSHG